MNDSILWLQLKSRYKPDKNCLYLSIRDIKQWVERISRLEISEQDEHYLPLLIEVNSLDIPVNERLEFLEALHQPVINLIDYHSRKYLGSCLPLAEDKSKYVNRVNSYWSEMATAYKIIIDDLSEDSFLTSFINKNDLSSSLFHVLFYLNGQLYSNYMLYSVCTENVWRDIHQIFRFATTKKLTDKTIVSGISEQLSITELYKKVLLFSLANPYHLTPQEKAFVWKNLDEWSQYASINFDNNSLKNHYTFIIQAYSDHAPFLNYQNKTDFEPDEMNISTVLSNSIWRIETEKLIKQLSDKNKYPDLSDYLTQRLSRNWRGIAKRVERRKGLIEPVVITLRASCVAQLLSQIENESNILKLDNIEEQMFELNSVTCLQIKAYLIDESKSGFRLKLGHNTEESIVPDIGEVIAIKHMDNGIHIGFLRWIRENAEGEIEFGVEHLCAMAEPVQLIKGSTNQSKFNPFLENINKLDSFVFPGGNEYNNQPILFTSTFVEKFYRVRSDFIILKHKTGSIKIKLVQKVNEVLGYSLYLFKKAADESE